MSYQKKKTFKGKYKANTVQKNPLNKKVLIAILVLITILSFSPVKNNDFLNFDDSSLLVKNEIVLGKIEGSQISEALKQQIWTPYYKPLVYISWIMEYHLFGMNPKVFHLDNLFIHILNSLLVFFILSIILNRISIDNYKGAYISFFAALLFALHPFKVESIAWAVERKDVLFSFFYLLGMLLYLKYLKKKQLLLLLLVGLCYLFSSLSKSQGITLIAILFLLDYVWKRVWNKNIIIEKWPIYIVFGLIIFLFGFIGGHSAENVINTNVMSYVKDDGLVYDPNNLISLPEPYKLFLLMNFRFWLFLLHLLFPVKMALVYPGFKIIQAVGWTIHLFPLLSIALLYFIIKNLKKYPVYIFATLFFALSLFPVLTLPGKGTNFLSDRYTYISSFSVLFIISYILIQKLSLKRSLLLFGLLILFYSVSTYSRVKLWKNDALIWEDNLSKYGDDVQPLNNLARYYAENVNNLPKALEYLNRSLAYSPNNLGALLFRGNVYGMMGEYDKSITDFENVLEKNPGNEEALNGISVGYAITGKKDLAVDNFLKIIKRRPNNATALQNLGILYYNIGNYDEAIKVLTRLGQLDQTDAKTYYYLALSYFNLTDYNNSVNSINSAIKINPTAENYLLKSKILFNAGKYQESKSIVEDLLRQGITVDSAYLKILGL